MSGLSSDDLLEGVLRWPARTDEFRRVRKALDAYSVHVKEVQAQVDGFRIRTGAGCVLLRDRPQEPERLEFMLEADRRLRESGFDQFSGMVATEEGTAFVEVEEVRYHMVQLVEGREVDFSGPHALQRAGRLLAAFHLAGRGWTPPHQVAPAGAWSADWPGGYQAALDELQEFRRTARRRWTDFDRIYVKRLDHFVRQGERAQELLSLCDFGRQSAWSWAESHLCHGDFHPGNLALDANGLLLVRSIETCGCGPRTRDHTRFLATAARWNLDATRAFLEACHAAAPLGWDEAAALVGQLVFPWEFWELARYYYRMQRDWKADRFLRRLDRLVDAERKRDLFLRELVRHLVERRDSFASPAG